MIISPDSYRNMAFQFEEKARDAADALMKSTYEDLARAYREVADLVVPSAATPEEDLDGMAERMAAHNKVA
jgi:hypothetical protein